MLGDGKLDSLDTRLEQFKLNNTNNQHELQTILKEYSQLLDAYKALRSASESKGSDVTSANTIVADTTCSPYVLVLVDGNGYIFNDELVKEKEEGGMRAARMLNDVVEKYLRDLPQAKDSRVIVRIYADLTNLSKQLAKVKLIGLEKRSLAPFAAGFTRAINFFDFVDALDEEGTRFKIRETFKLAAEDDACRHILFGACHDSSYVSQLAPYNGLQSKITLVQGAGFNSEFYQFGLNMAQFPTVFRWSELAPASATKASASITMRTASPQKALPPTYKAPKVLRSAASDWRAGSVYTDQFPPLSNGVDLLGINDNTEAISEDSTVNEGNKKTKMCKYFQKGFCRFGNKCNFIHVPDSLNPSAQISAPTTQDRKNISSDLPTSIPSGFIALNKDAQRIDTYMRPPTTEEWLIYNARFHRQKPCNSHHLHGACTNFNCAFDHHPLEVESQHCLEYVLKCSPCPRKGACRAGDCFQGHICQKDGCVGQMKGCRMKMDLHSVDPKLASVVPVEEVLVHDEFQGGIPANGFAEPW